MNNVNNKGPSLCKNCKYRFRRVFIPLDPDDYVDEDGDSILRGEDNIIITNVCLLSGMDIDREVTVECNHFKEKIDEKDTVPFFKHL
jgi:hypothetical protein